MKHKWLILFPTVVVSAGLVTTIALQHEKMRTLPEQLPREVLAEDIQASEEERLQQGEQHVANDIIDYSFANEEVHITFDYGDNWVDVPVTQDALLFGELSNHSGELASDSYILTNDYTAFLYEERDSESESYTHPIRILLTEDQGETWKDAVVAENLAAVRFRKIDLIDDSFGYVMMTADRTMSSEWTGIYVTNDGGHVWTEMSRPDTTRLVHDGNFLDQKRGFLSYGTINPTEPSLYYTADGGGSWTEAEVVIPEEYTGIFVQADMPFIDGDQLLMRVNQGSIGDYKGGTVNGEFISEDNGASWTFVEEVEPDE